MPLKISKREEWKCITISDYAVAWDINVWRAKIKWCPTPKYLNKNKQKNISKQSKMKSYTKLLAEI